MVFDLEDLFEQSSDFVKYSLEPYPSYFHYYDWKNAEIEADENIKSEKYNVWNVTAKPQDNQEESNRIIKDRKTERFYRDFVNLPDNVQKRITDKIFPLLFTDPKYSAVNARKVKDQPGRWRIKIDMYYSFTFDVSQGYIILRCIGPIERT
ncbi:MAG: hypothetical protein ACUZ8E_10775 [Candidatus Anammoxibacter sp.]